MPSNLTRAEMEQMQAAVISNQDGLAITSADHRSFNSALMDFNNSFLPFDGKVTGVGVDDGTGSKGSITNSALVKRDVAFITIVATNQVIGPHNFTKTTVSDTLFFTNGVSLEIATDVTVTLIRT